MNSAYSAKPFRVLSLDGGGVRGLYTASLLNQLCVRFSQMNKSPSQSRFDLGAKFDLIAGTSTGSIIAMALAAGVPLEDVVALYRGKAGDIFSGRMPLQTGGVFAKAKAALWVLQNLLAPANSSVQLSSALVKIFAADTVEQLYLRRNIALCIPSIDAETQLSWVFKTPHLARLSRDNKYSIVDVCLASSAAPVFFPMHSIDRPDLSVRMAHIFVDGGLWANNPILVALVEALEVAAPDQPIEILSVGTSPATGSQVLTQRDRNRGSLGWKGGIDIVNMAMEAQTQAVPYMARQIAGAVGHVSIHRLLEPQVSPTESVFLKLDSGHSESISVLETLAQRATDINVSHLTSAASDTAETRMVKAMFSDLTVLPGSPK